MNPLCTRSVAFSVQPNYSHQVGARGRWRGAKFDVPEIAAGRLRLPASSSSVSEGIAFSKRRCPAVFKNIPGAVTHIRLIIGSVGAKRHPIILGASKSFSELCIKRNHFCHPRTLMVALLGSAEISISLAGCLLYTSDAADD